MASSEDEDLLDNTDGGGDDLFGEVSDADDAPVENARELSDRELDSGDDEDRNDRAPEEEDEEREPSRKVKVVDLDIWKHNLPKPSDGEINLLRLPKFLSIDPLPFDSKTFQPPTADHHSDTKSVNFSARAVSASTMRYRLGKPSNKLESNTVVYRWSDGSTTLGIGEQHYELQTKPLAPPRDRKPYQEILDSHSYIASPSIASQVLFVAGHMTNEYTVRPNKDIEDDALEKLQRNLANAAGNKGANKNGPELITITQDPELEKKKAEIAEKERMRAQRRRENAAEKANIPRHAMGGRGGLSVDDLEGRSGRRAAGSGRKAPKQRRRRPEYDSDDELPRGRNREDEYDKNDDFLASSDEEEEVEAEEEEEEMLDEDSDRERPKAKKQKISRPEEVSDADADAEADLDDVDAPVAAPAPSSEPAGRGRKRNIIEDDDDE